MIHTEYYKDGTPCECDEIKRGHYASGTLWYEAPYVNGKHHGITKEYYKSGDLEWETPYVKGKWHGIEKRYTGHGILKKEFLWLNDNMLSRPAENFH